MKTATVREVRQSFGKLLEAVRDGETVAITSRRRVVATLGPPPPAPQPRRPWAGIDAWLATQPSRPSLDVAALLAEERDAGR